MFEAGGGRFTGSFVFSSGAIEDEAVGAGVGGVEFGDGVFTGGIEFFSPGVPPGKADEYQERSLVFRSIVALVFTLPAGHEGAAGASSRNTQSELKSFNVSSEFLKLPSYVKRDSDMSLFRERM
mgnify:CR=1 FL=1